MTQENPIEESAESAYAYTPGLKVKRRITVRKTRRLPILGETLVEKGDEVDFITVVARTEVPGEPYILRVDELLGLLSGDVPTFMVKKEGEKVEEEEIIARYSPFFGLFKKVVKSPVSGTVEQISDDTGRVVIRASPIPVEVKAYIRGVVSEVLPKEGVIIDASAAFIQGIFGIGGERNGELITVVDSQNDILTAEKIVSGHEGKILVGGSLVTLEALRKASKSGVAGIVVGGIKGADLSEFLGYEIGVAITGEEDINLTLVVTEGFGMIRMSDRTFNLLKEFNGYQAAINGTTQIRAGVLRPEIIIPHTLSTLDSREEDANSLEGTLAEGMKPGNTVRIIGEPYFGSIGKVVSLPVQLQKIETKSLVRVIEVELENGNMVIVPRANVETIEE